MPNLQNRDHVYILGDGDKVRIEVESHLFNHDFENLKEFSQNLATAIKEIKDLAISIMKAEVIMAGGDDILFFVDKEKYQLSTLRMLCETFHKICGITISFGVGESIETAYINMRKAKTSKVNKIIEE